MYSLIVAAHPDKRRGKQGSPTSKGAMAISLSAIRRVDVVNHQQATCSVSLRSHQGSSCLARKRQALDTLRMRISDRSPRPRVGFTKFSLSSRLNGAQANVVESAVAPVGSGHRNEPSPLTSSPGAREEGFRRPANAATASSAPRLLRATHPLPRTELTLG